MLNPVTGILIRVEDKDTHTRGRRLCKDGDRDWRHMAKSQGMPVAATTWKRQERSLPQSLQKDMALMTH